MAFSRFASAVFCGFVVVSCDSAPKTGPIDDMLDQAVASGRIPGVIAMAAESDGTIYSGAAGLRDVSGNAEIALDTLVQIASMTKPVTSVAVMQLVERGLVGLDDPIGQYLPRLADVQVLDGFDDQSNPILRAPQSPVTIRQLLSHTSGYVYEFWNAAAARNVEQGGVPSIFEAGDGFLGAPLAFDPGTRWEYGINLDILGALVAEVSGQSLADYFAENIFAPLGMSDTFYIVPEEKLARVATVYARSDEGEMTAQPFSNPSGRFYSGGNGLVSTAGDYIRFLRMFLNGGELDGVRILSAETVNQMAQNQIGDLEAGIMPATLVPGFSNAFDLVPDSEDKFGFGFMINTEPVPGGRSAGSLAWGGIYNTYFWVDREKGICGVFLTQILPFFDTDAVDLFGRFERAVYSSLDGAES